MRKGCELGMRLAVPRSQWAAVQGWGGGRQGRIACPQVGEAASSQTTQGPMQHGKELGFYFKGQMGSHQRALRKGRT